MDYYSGLPDECVDIPLQKAIEIVNIAQSDSKPLTTKDWSFFESISSASKKSEKQEWWIRFLYGCALGLVDRKDFGKPAVSAETHQMVADTAVSVPYLVELMKGKKGGIVLNWNGNNVKLALSGKTSKNYGGITLSDGVGFKTGVWYGFVKPTGKLVMAPSMGTEKIGPFKRWFKKLGTPMGLARQLKVAHLEMGICGLCGEMLATETSSGAEMVGFHYGCASNVGLMSEYNTLGMEAVLGTLGKKIMLNTIVLSGEKGNKVNAIKFVRAVSRHKFEGMLGLKEAKELVDADATFEAWEGLVIEYMKDKYQMGGFEVNYHHNGG